MKNFLIYKSSAGSGKTYTLVKEYLKLVLTDPDNFRSTLAVTFTNKAAQEMKSRVISSLIKLSKGEDKTLSGLLASEGVKGDIQIKAAGIMQLILHKYSDFSVSTIDSFFHKIIRSFAKELKLQLGYDIELDQDKVLDKIVNDMLDGIDSNSELRKYLEEYIFNSIDDDKGWKIESRIREIAGEIFKERYWLKKGNGSDLADSREKMKEFIGTLYSIIRDFEIKLTGIGERALKLISECGLDILDFKQHTANHFVKISKKTNYPDKITPVNTFRMVVSGEGKWFTQKSLKKNKIIELVDSGLQRLAEEAITYHDINFRKYTTANVLIKTVYVLGIFKDLLDKLKDYRDENRLMLISDTNNLLTKVISGDNSPFVYEKIGNVYKHFLIDEFQDTSTFQWNNFLPLIENSLGENNLSMIVGDVKQSIYRWRNGNMKLLLEGVKNDLSGFEEIIGEETLKQNFRSKKEIVQFNNEFFKNAPGLLAGRIGSDEKQVIIDAYEDVEQIYEENSGGGHVGVNFIGAEEDDGLNPRELSIRKTIDLINQAISSGYAQRDILVLVRKRDDGSEAAYYLTQSGFRVVSGDSMLLTNSPGVKLLLNLLKYIISSQNNLARTEILYNYIRFFNEDIFGSVELNSIFNDHKINTDSLFFATLPSEFFSADRKSVNGDFFSLSLYEIVETLIRIFRLNTGSDIYLLRFLDVIKEYISKNNSDITAFIDWWEENRQNYSILVPESEDAIRVMTIHKAKGLESPIVILPYCSWEMDISGARDKIWATANVSPFNASSSFLVKAVSKLKESYFEKDYYEEAVLTNLDNLNLLYVAFTRAIDRLYINVPAKRIKIFDTGKLVWDTIESSGGLKDMLEGMKNKDLKKPDGNRTGAKKTEGAYKMSGIVSTGFREKIVIKPLWKDVKLEKTVKFSEMKNRGIILHKALAGIKLPGDLDAAVQNLIAEGLITKESSRGLRNELEAILNLEESGNWFQTDYEVKTEAELLLPGGETFRPDRVMIKNNEAIIIDYKTGSEKAEHKLQLNKYADILKEMGYNKIEKYLFYIMLKKTVRVQ